MASRTKSVVLAQLKSRVRDIDAGRVEIRGVPVKQVRARLDRRIKELEGQGVKEAKNPW